MIRVLFRARTAACARARRRWRAERAAGMEAESGLVRSSQTLTPQEKEQLKEKLAVLKREYKKTFLRLQRAERSVKVKSCTKKTVAEQYREEAEEDQAGSISQLSPRPSEKALVGPYSENSAAKAMPVLFMPKTFEGNWPETSSSRHTYQAGERAVFNSVEPPFGRNCSRRSSSRSRVQPKSMPSLEEKGEPVCEAHQRDTSCQPEHETTRVQGSRSPVFKRRSAALQAVQSGLPKLLLPSAEGGVSNVTPKLLQPDSEQGRFEETDFPGVRQTPCSVSQGPLLEHLREEDVSPALEALVVQNMVLCADMPKEEEDSAWMEEELWRELAEPAVIQGERSAPRNKMGGGDISPERLSGRMEGAPLEAGPSPLEGAALTSPSEKRFDSCTVVEGLPFPVEYYIRTTRRLSHCPKELNLEAVIKSQLGRGRKAGRKTRQQQTLSPALSSQEAAQREDGLNSPSHSSSKSIASSSLRGQEGSGEQPPNARKPPDPAEESHPTHPRLVQQGGTSWPPLEPSAASLAHRARRASRNRRRRLPRAALHPASPHLSGMASAAGAFPFLTQNLEMGGLEGLPSDLGWQEFHLPEEEFGFLKSEKLRAASKKLSEISGTGRSEEGPLRTAADALTKGGLSGENVRSAGKETPPVHSSGELLLSPTSDGRCSLLQSQLPTPEFPHLGATPALHPSESFGASSLLTAVPAVSSSPSGGARPLCSQDRVGIGQAKEEVGKQLPAEKHSEEAPCQDPTTRDGLGEALGNSWRERGLQMTSKVKNSSGSGLVDVSTVWWKAADFPELCVMIAEETSMSLWRHLDPGHWGTVHTWYFAKMPVIQIVPLPDAHSMVCVVLGPLEMAEIRLLFNSSEDGCGCAQQRLVKAGSLNTVLGLTDRKLVSSCCSLKDQEVEVISFTEAGRSQKSWTLMSPPPEETVLAFAEVAGMEEALLGMTAVNCVILWNLGTRQLLKKVAVACSFPSSLCHGATSDSGLLFVVLSPPHAEESQLCGNLAFQVAALNPKTARSAGLLLMSLPPGVQGRYMGGDVRGASAAAVLTSGTIAVWDLFLGQCTALLPPNSEGRWSLARWSVTDACLLAGQDNGALYVYSYSGGLCSA